MPPRPSCGEPTTVLVSASGLLEVSATFPDVVDRSGDETFAGTVTVTAAGRPLVGVTSPDADVYVTRSGTVVATPLAKDLRAVPVRLLPGASQDLAASGSLRACAPPAALLPAGRYDVFAVVTITDDAGDTITATSKPWPLTVV